MANRRKRAIARNITFAIGCTRRKRKSKKLTSLRKSYSMLLSVFLSRTSAVTVSPPYFGILQLEIFTELQNLERVKISANLNPSRDAKAKSQNLPNVIYRVSIVTIDVKIVLAVYAGMYTSAPSGMRVNDIIPVPTSPNSRGGPSSPLPLHPTHACRACVHAYTHRVALIMAARSFEMPLQHAVSIVPVIDRGDRDRTNGNDSASLVQQRSRLIADGVTG